MAGTVSPVGKIVAEKLLIKPGTSVWTSDDARRDLLGPLPSSATWADDPGGATSAIVIADDAAIVRRVFAAHRDALAASGNLWVLYPKANKADINRDSLWPILSKFGLRPITQVAVDETWSALRFRQLREGEERFAGRR